MVQLLYIFRGILCVVENNLVENLTDRHHYYNRRTVLQYIQKHKLKLQYLHEKTSL